MVLLAQGIRNTHLEDLDVDFLYHLGLSTADDLEAMFGDVKFVCMGGSADRAETFANKVAEDLGFAVPEGGAQPIGKTERFSLYKVGPVISVNHGMGQPSLEILLNEIAKLLDYAGCDGVTFVRVGTSGGVGVESGTVVVTEEALDGELQPQLTSVQLGRRRTYPTQTNAELVRELVEVSAALGARFKVVVGRTMSADGFYEEQGRLDGALKPEYTEEDKLAFLAKAYEVGVRNIEMEACRFAAFCLRAGIPATIVCAALLNRLEGDQVSTSDEERAGYSDDAQTLVIEWMRKRLASVGAIETPQ